MYQSLVVRVGYEMQPKRTTYTRSQRDWPKPPSGIELNDMAGDKYKSCPEAGANEKIGSSALKQAVENYERREGKPGKRR